MPDSKYKLAAPDRRLQSTVLLVGFALLVAVVLGCAWLVKRQTEDNADVRRVLQLQNHLARSLSLLQDAETGQRGYLLTHDVRYLKPYEGSAKSFFEELDEIEKLLVRKERMSELAEIRKVAQAKFAELEQTISKMKGGDQAGALAIVKTDQGMLLMNEVRAMLARMVAFDDRALKERLAAANANAQMLQWSVLIAIFSVLLLAAYVLAANRKHVLSLIDLIAHRERSESQIRQMQKMQAIGQLTGGIAHDFNNMLAIVIGSLSLMQKRLSRGNTDVSRYADAAMEGAQRAATLTSRLLAFSRQQPLMPVTLDLNKTVAGMSELIRRTIGESIQMETVLAGGLWRALADASEVENAILNLCVNARDAMPEGGKLTIETANCYLDENYAAAHADVEAGQYVLIAVTDTGTGMSPEIISRAFDPFFTTKPSGKGTGLGLSQVYGFVKQSGGHVKIYSESPQGTTVKIYLPRTERADVAVPQEKVASPRGNVENVILVVEDEARVRGVSVTALRELGYTVIHADSGGNALEKLRAYPGVSLLFTDIVMPGMNGKALATAALKDFPHLKVLYTTGYTHNAVVHNGVVDADAQLIVKPYTVDQLATKVHEVLQMK
ncbi:MAG TPA: CHASE3 domain-containing protein [Xanthobacteraceae bacterium]|nr:CHASE3 domain-containing protein [Xanthobacteraceae bacterium]